jgi:hypothetical protein
LCISFQTKHNREASLLHCWCRCSFDFLHYYQSNFCQFSLPFFLLFLTLILFLSYAFAIHIFIYLHYYYV